MSSKISQSLTKRHTLQRMASPSRGFSAVVHVLGLSSFLCSFDYMHRHPNPANEAYGWHFQYLTVIGLALATCTFATGLLADVTLSPRLFLLKNLLSVCSTPLQVLISLMYWTLRLIDPRLVLPEWAETPLYADVSFHAVPSIVMILDLVLLSPPWTVTVLPALGISGVLAFSYWFWVEQCYQHNGWYPYPIFEQLATTGRIGLFTLSATVMATSTITLKWLHGRVNGFPGALAAVDRPGGHGAIQ